MSLRWFRVPWILSCTHTDSCLLLHLGRLGQVLAVSFLPGSTFPVVNFVTTVFDLFNDEGLLLAASGLFKMVALNSLVESQCNDRPTSPQIDMEIDLGRYHLKSVNTFFEVVDGDCRDKSLVRFFEMTSILRSHGFACCPLAYRLGDKKSGYPDDAIVFENLHRLGYCIVYRGRVLKKDRSSWGR